MTNHAPHRFDGDPMAIDIGDTRADLGALLLHHNLVADRELLDICSTLTDEQLDTEFPMGLNTLRDTLAHNLGALRAWSDVYAERDMRPWLPTEGPFTIERLGKIAEALHTDWFEIASQLPLDGEVTWSRGETHYRYTRAQIIAHVTTHAVHHRAQAINMLRQLGVATEETPLPTGSVMSWVRTLPGVDLSKN